MRLMSMRCHFTLNEQSFQRKTLEGRNMEATTATPIPWNKHAKEFRLISLQ